MDVLFHGLLITVLLLFAFGLIFILWVLWTARNAFKSFGVEIRSTIKKSWNNSYTKEELYEKISVWEKRNKPKYAVYWRRRLYEIYPEEIPNGKYHS
jgi:hypothetical protein